METVKLTIDGEEVTVEKGRTVLQAAIESGHPSRITAITPGWASMDPAASAS